MKRRDFIYKSLATSTLLASVPIIDLFSLSHQRQVKASLQFDNVDLFAETQMIKVLEWMGENGWQAYLKNSLNINISLNGNTELEDFQKEIDNISDVVNNPGLEDFAGTKLVEPGSPSLSLLYHILASPRVRPEGVIFPELSHLDTIENYIYSFVNPVSYPYQKSNLDNVFLAILSYEYRPSSKVPPFEGWKRGKNEFAQLVFSRTGISRIGNEGLHYDSEIRSFTNLPNDPGQEKNIAVHPARYGLYLVELCPWYALDDVNVHLMNEQQDESTNKGSSPRYFINPIKKISRTSNEVIEFGEYHVNEKLRKLTEYSYDGTPMTLNPGLDYNRPPFVRISATNDRAETLMEQAQAEAMVQLGRIGDSVLLSSIPKDLIRKAQQDEKLVSLEVPKAWKKINTHTNRRYGALKLPNPKGREVTNVLISDVLGRKKRRTSSLRAPKISPLFVNIKFEVQDTSKPDLKHIDGLSYEANSFETKIEEGGYHSLLFEDSICDGCVSAKIHFQDTTSAPANFLSKRQVLPAFSLVTAPDFFPFVDSNDLRAYYMNNDEVNTDQDFFEGGTINLSGLRQRGNPEILDPFSGEIAFKESWSKDKSFDTLTAVVATGNAKEGPQTEYLLNFKREYKATSYLPDTGTGIFFPGWDVTYSGDKENSYFATYGLGSPFPEDMKLCAAANGMWPVSSPDAGRTFQGSLEPVLGMRPNTAIPLMDNEIGFHKKSPYVKHFGEKENNGWDGEQGPFLEINESYIMIKYTDIGRADYLQNLLDPEVGFDMSRLRDLDSTELIHRMDCFRKCIRHIDNKQVWKTKLWLVGAQKINDWSVPQNIECLPDEALFNNLNAHIPNHSEMKGSGYFYVFVKAAKNKGKNKGELDKEDKKQKRLLLPCSKVWICQVTRHALAYTQLKRNKKAPGKWILKGLG